MSEIIIIAPVLLAVFGGVLATLLALPGDGYGGRAPLPPGEMGRDMRDE